MKPKAREGRLKIEPLEEETLVVDLERNKAHCLNKAAAVVWESCDGKTTVAEITGRLHRDLGLPHRQSVTLLGVQQLRRAGLLEPGSVPECQEMLISRRQLGAALSAKAALLLPLVASITIPTAATAQSTRRKKK